MVRFYPWFNFYFPLFWGKVMYDNEFETVGMNDNISTGCKKLFFEESMVLNIFKTTSLCWELVLLRFKSKITTTQLHL